MKKLAIIFNMLIIFFVQDLVAKSCHLLLIGDKDDTRLHFSTERNFRNVEQSFSYICSVSGIPFRSKRISRQGVELSQYEVEKWIRKEPIAPDDVIILYYSSHGGRTTDTPTIWPFGCFSDGYVDFSAIIENLFPKKAALYVIILDCCNVFTKGWEVLGERLRFELRGLNDQLVARGFQKLFCHKPYGLIIASGTSPGEVGWHNVWDDALPIKPEDNAKMGGVFTNIFLNNLFQEIQTPSPEWKRIFKKTKIEVIEETMKEDYSKIVPASPLKPQTPQYRIFLYKHKRSAHTYLKDLYKGCAYHKSMFDQNPEISQILP